MTLPRLSALLAAVAVGAVMLAGCSDDGNQDPAGLRLQEVETTATEGSISGVTVDEAIRPVAGVTVTLLGTDRNTTTDEGGLFVFEFLAPGLYTLSTAPVPEGPRRFLGIQTTAEVKAAETAKVRIVLPSDPTPQPFLVTLKFDGFFQVGSGFFDEVMTLAVYNKTYGPVTTPAATCTCVWGFAIEERPATFVVDLAYTDTVPNPMPQFWTFKLESELDDPPLWFCYENPCNAHIPGSNFSAEARNYTVHVWSDPAWVAVNQSFQLFITMFHVAAAPEDWSFLDQQPA